jgi:hypothetical protein
MRWLLILGALPLLPVCWTTMRGTMNLWEEGPMVWLNLFFLPLSVFVWLPAIAFLGTWWAWRQSAEFRGPHTVEFLDSCIIITTPTASSTLGWNHIKRAERRGNLLVLWLAFFRFFYVPLGALSGPEQVEDLKVLLDRNLRDGSPL